MAARRIRTADSFVRPGYREHSPARVLADGSCPEDRLKPCAD